MDELIVHGMKIPQYRKNDPIETNVKAIVGFTIFGVLAGVAAYVWTSHVEGRIYNIVNEDLRDAFINGHWEAE